MTSVLHIQTGTEDVAWNYLRRWLLPEDFNKSWSTIVDDQSVAQEIRQPIRREVFICARQSGH